MIKLFRGKDPRLRQSQERGIYFTHKENENLEQTIRSPHQRESL